MRRDESALEIVKRWIESGQLNVDMPRSEEEARKIMNDLLEA